MAGERLGECGGVGDDLLGVGLERRVEHLTEGDGLGGDGVLERAALQAREHGLVDGGGMLSTAQDATTTRAPERLVRGEGHDVDIRHRIGMHATGDQTGNVRGVEHEQGTDLIGDLTERRRIDDAGRP